MSARSANRPALAESRSIGDDRDLQILAPACPSLSLEDVLHTRIVFAVKYTELNALVFARVAQRNSIRQVELLQERGKTRVVVQAFQ